MVAPNPAYSNLVQTPDIILPFYGFRYYDAVTGRWPSRDPIGERGGLNVYGLVGSDPINQWDVLGLLAISIYYGGDESALNSIGDLVTELVDIGGGSTISKPKRDDDGNLVYKDYHHRIQEHLNSTQEFLNDAVDKLKAMYPSETFESISLTLVNNQNGRSFSNPSTEQTRSAWRLWNSNGPDHKLWMEHLDKIAPSSEPRVLFTNYLLDHPEGMAGGVGGTSGMIVRIDRTKDTLAHEFGHWLGVSHQSEAGYLMSKGPEIGADPKISCAFADALKEKYYK